MVNNKNYEIPEEMIHNWQEIVNLLAELADIPSALVMRYTNPDIGVFVSSETDGNPYKVGDHDVLDKSGLYCETVIKTQKELHIPNALKLEEWKDNPDIKLNMISYLGYPLVYPDNEPFGTICILGSETSTHSVAVEKLMKKFKNLIESHIEISYMNNQLGDEEQKMSDYLQEIKAFRGIVTMCSSCKSIRDEHEHWHQLEEFIDNHPKAQFSHGLCPVCVKKMYPNFKKK